MTTNSVPRPDGPSLPSSSSPKNDRSRDDLARCEILMPLCQSGSQSAEVLALKHESRILREDECLRILLSCYRARNSGPGKICSDHFVAERQRGSVCVPPLPKSLEQNPHWN